MPNGTYGGVKGRRKSALFDCSIIVNHYMIPAPHRFNQYKMFMSENIINTYKKLLIEIRGISDEL